MEVLWREVPHNRTIGWYQMNCGCVREYYSFRTKLVDGLPWSCHAQPLHSYRFHLLVNFEWPLPGSGKLLWRFRSKTHVLNVITRKIFTNPCCYKEYRSNYLGMHWRIIGAVDWYGGESSSSIDQPTGNRLYSALSLPILNVLPILRPFGSTYRLPFRSGVYVECSLRKGHSGEINIIVILRSTYGIAKSHVLHRGKF